MNQDGNLKSKQTDKLWLTMERKILTLQGCILIQITN
jgi:hypothetical protein